MRGAFSSPVGIWLIPRLTHMMQRYGTHWRARVLTAMTIFLLADLRSAARFSKSVLWTLHGLATLPDFVVLPAFAAVLDGKVLFDPFLHVTMLGDMVMLVKRGNVKTSRGM
jgi:hypothetical protein